MNSQRRPLLSIAIVLVLSSPLVFGCELAGAINKIWNQDDVSESAREGKRLQERDEEMLGRKAETHPAPAGTDEIITLSITGENPAFHTGLLGRTVYYIDYESGTVQANESAPFEEPGGIQTRRGTDTIGFSGTYDAAAKTISGTLTIKTVGTATGGESPANTVTYKMSGQLEAALVGDEWSGTVTGTSRLTQAWADESGLDVDDSRSVSWSVKSATREVGSWD